LEKEFLYVGHYVDTEGNYMLKIGTTNDLDRRATEHTRNYRRAKTHTLPPNKKFEYDWHIALSKYNTLRCEDKNRQKWIDEKIGKFIRNDRFCCGQKPKEVEVVVRKTYKVAL
jgi:predicted GIY-YIG superfamily endonuclease